MSDEPLTPAEQRLASLLALLRSDAVRSRPMFVAGIMKQVRWQRFVREVVEAVASFASALADGVAVLVGGRPRGGSRR
ncbi:MAG: hypothetical protein H0V11_02490 [Actinobacteria bacterium]|nr:hypothetical protein [Actinomycetota bacterium]